MGGDGVGLDGASTSSPGIEEESIMHMLDWNTYRQQLVAGVGGLGKLNPDLVKGYTTLSRAGQKAGQLDEKTRELSACGRHHPALRWLHHGAYRGGPGTGRDQGGDRRSAGRGGLRQCQRGRR